MGGAVSSGESNDDLIDNLLEADYIKSPLVERVFRAVDRAFYYTDHYKQNAYKDLAWKDGNLHLSAPCIYSEVLENLDLKPGMCFLNVGSGTGYFSTMCGLIIGKNGVNHGIEVYQDVVNYAMGKLVDFLETSPAVDEFDFCPPEFAIGNCLDATPASMRYDRIYCGAAASDEYVKTLIDMLKIGGVCVVPIGDSLMRIVRVDHQKDQRSTLLPVSFANLISPKEDIKRVPVELPDWSPLKLTELCRAEIRKTMRQTIILPERKNRAKEYRKKKRKRRHHRSRGTQLVLLQQRRPSSDEDRNSTPEENRSPQVEVSDDQVERSPEAVPDPIDLEAEPMSHSLASNDEASTANSGASVATSSRNGVVVASGTATINRVSRTAGNKREATDNGGVSDATVSSTTDNRNDAIGFLSRGRIMMSAARSGRNMRRTTADMFLETLQVLVRGRGEDLNVSVTRQPPHRNRSSTDQSSSPSTSGRDEDEANAEGDYAPDPHDVDLSSSSSDSSSFKSDSSSSSDDDIGADEPGDVARKRCKSDFCNKTSNHAPKPDPLLVNPASVQMRKKIIELPLPPALKVYLNYDRKLHYP